MVRRIARAPGYRRSTLLLATLVAAACNGDSATAPRGSARSTPVSFAATAPGASVFGPELFVRSTGSPNGISRTLAPDALANALPPFTLHIRNGPSEMARASSAVVMIDGIVVAGPSDFSRNSTGFDRTVDLKAGSEITVQMRGAPGSAIELIIEGVAQLETAPGLVSPAQGARVTQNDPTSGCPISATYGYGFRIGFAWTPATGPKAIAGYELSAGYAGAIPIISSFFVTETSYQHTDCGFVMNSRIDGWQWQVRARYVDGSVGPSSPTGTFGFTPMPAPAPVVSFTLSPPSYPAGKTQVSLSGTVDGLTAASVVLSAVVNIAQSADPITVPYPLIEFFWDNGVTRQKIGDATNPTLLQTQTDRFWTYTFTWDPAAPTPVGTVSIVAVRTEYGGSFFNSASQIVTIVP